MQSSHSVSADILTKTRLELTKTLRLQATYRSKYRFNGEGVEFVTVLKKITVVFPIICWKNVLLFQNSMLNQQSGESEAVEWSRGAVVGGGTGSC